ncbi:MAG: Hsp20/alpha crystallin family protein [Nanobdellota archaeon]
MSIWDDMERMHRHMDKMFGNFFDRNEGMLPGPEGSDSYRNPLTDVWETDNEVVSRIEMPGVNKDDIEINATDDSVEIKVEKKDEYEQEDKKSGTYRMERKCAGFYRSIPMPNADTSQAEASYKDGVLELRAPKKEESKKKQISVK